METDDLPLEAAIAARDALAVLLESTASLINAMDSVPLPQSVVYSEQKAFHRPLAIKTAHLQAGLLLESAADYLSALHKSLTEPVETIAPWGIARTVTESSAISVWIGRPDLDVDERVRRSMAFWGYCLKKHTYLHKITAKEGAPQLSTVGKFILAAQELGYQFESDSVGLPKDINNWFPGFTNVYITELNAEVAYRTCSAQMHSMPYAAQQLSYKAIGISETDPDIVRAEKHFSNSGVCFVCHESAKAFIRAFSARLKAHGYLNQTTKKVFDAVKRQLLIDTNTLNFRTWTV